MLCFVILSLVLAVPMISLPYWPQYRPDQVGYGWGPLCGGNVPCPYRQGALAQGTLAQGTLARGTLPQGTLPPYGHCPPPNTVHNCNHTEWICPKDPKIRRDHTAVPPPPGTYVTFCEYDEQCVDVDSKPHKCCYDSTTNARICKPAIKRTI